MKGKKRLTEGTLGVVIEGTLREGTGTGTPGVRTREQLCQKNHG